MTNYARQEDILKAQIIERLKDDFMIRAEVSGEHIFYKQLVKVDFLAYPKQHLIDSGFDPFPFAIEAKHIKNTEFVRVIDLIVQAISYQMSVYPGRTALLRPMFTLICVNYKSVLGNDTTPSYRAMWSNALRIGQKLNIGELDVLSDWYRWAISFTSSKYFARKTNGDIKIGNVKNIGRKIYAGNTGTKRPLTTDWNGANYDRRT